MDADPRKAQVPLLFGKREPVEPAKAAEYAATDSEPDIK